MPTTIYNDLPSATSFYGNSTYGNFDINNPTTNWHKSSTSLDSFQSFLPNIQSSSLTSLKNFSATFKPTNFQPLIFFNINQQTQIAQISVGDFLSLSATTNFDASNQNPQLTCTITPNSFSLFLLNYNSTYSFANKETLFISCSKIQNVNTGQNGYYSQDYRSHYSLILSYNSTTQTAHFLNNQQKQTLQNFEFAIVCQNNQAPYSKWLTSFLLFDNNEALGNPCIGLYPDLILGTGQFTVGQLIEIAPGSQRPTTSTATHFYTPTCKLSNNRTILQRIHKL